MKTNLQRFVLLAILLGSFGFQSFAQTNAGNNKIKIFNHPMNPRLHPDDARRYVKPPDATTFGNQIQFMALRSLDGDYKKLLDDYTIKFKLGNIIWPSYPILYKNNLVEVVAELKKRELYLFDLWGYVPGSGPGGYWQQFVVPQNALNLFERELGERWLGMDNGEQDGRYVGGFAGQMIPVGNNHEQQYLNFQNHFQGLTDRLGNKMATLVSLNFGHYFLKEGVYTMIGAETAQGLPNAQVYYSFIRGAGKQYGVPWFGNASVWNRWGWKNYTGNSDYNGGDTEGTSLSLLKRLIYSHIMYDCVAVGFESSFLDNKEELSPIGKIQQSAVQWVEKNGDPGNLYTPIAVMVDFFSGWSFPRHLYSGNIYRVWGNLPYQKGDYLTDGIWDIFYPGYQDASYFHDETGFITPTPFGDVADCILSDCPLWLLKQYPVLVIGGTLRSSIEVKDKLENYIKDGGHLVITAKSLENMPKGLAGITVGNKEISFDTNASIQYNNKELKEASAFTIKEILPTSETKLIASCDNHSLIVEQYKGLGKITVFASPYGLGSEPLDIPKPKIDSRLKSPFPLLNHFKVVLEDIFSQNTIFQAGKDLSLITCHKNKNEYTVAICNNSWMEKPFNITSDINEIITITEMPIDCSEQSAVGFLPKSIENNTGQNSEKTIAGGDIRIFSIKTKGNNIEETTAIELTPNPIKRGLTLRNISSIKEEILLRPTFFQHFDRVVIDWKYLHEREKSILVSESNWIKNQGLELIVDFSSGINLFPDLRLVNNDSLEFERSIKVIKSVIDKMNLLGANNLIMKRHRMVENNISKEIFDKSFQNTLKEICQYSLKQNINIYLRTTSGNNATNLSQALAIVKAVNEPNLYLAPVSSLILRHQEDLGKNIKLLKNLKSNIFLIAAPESDIFGSNWNENKAINSFPNKELLKQLLEATPECTFILDGLYSNKDEEYLDIKTLENLHQNDK